MTNKRVVGYARISTEEQSNFSIDGQIEQIEALEKLITPRRYREAILSGDHSFIESIESQIQAIRSSM